MFHPIIDRLKRIAELLPTAIGGEFVPQKITWNQCPTVVRNYITSAQETYTSNNDITIIDNYAPSQGNVIVSNTKPVGYTIDNVTFINNIPNVVTPFATENNAGTLTALDFLRWINSTPAPPASGSSYQRGINCRDLGGWNCDGGTIKYGMLVRGGEPNSVDKDLMVNTIGIKTDVQLLPVSEQATDYKMKSPWEIDWAGNTTENDSIYTLNDSKVLWKQILESIMNSVIYSKPVFFHCGVGADRTGLIASALEGVLGVNKVDVDIEYELTNFALGWQNLTGGIYRSRNYTSYKAIMTQLDNVPLAYGLDNTFRNKWVSFVLSCGISIDTINNFRNACIDGNPDIIVITEPDNVLTMNDGLINKRFNATNTVSDINGHFITDYFEYSGRGLRIVNGNINMGNLGTTNYANCRIGFYDANKSVIDIAYIGRTDNVGTNKYVGFPSDGDDLVDADLTTYTGVSDWSLVKYIRMTLALNNASSAIASVDAVLNSGMKIYEI